MRLDVWRQEAIERILNSHRLAQERIDICAYIVKWMRKQQAPTAEGTCVSEILGALQVAGFEVDDLACRRALRYLDLTRAIERGPKGQGYLLRSRPEDAKGRTLDLP